MKLATAVLLAVFMGGSFALPTNDPTLARREDNTFFPIFWPFVNTPAPAPANGPTITAPGANLNGGSFIGGNGGNGGTISIGRRDKDTIFPFFWPSFNTPAPVNGPTINAGGASLNGGNFVYGDGGNGGKISIGRRDEAAVSSGGRTSNSRREDDFFFPIFWPSSNTPAPVNGPTINAAGASLNGGYYINGDGGNGGTISIGRRDEDTVSSGGRTSNSRREDDFFFPIFWPSSNTPAPANGPAINAAGASLNGGNYINGNGGNGGTISIN